MRLLVCGGAGFIGSTFVRIRLRDHGDAPEHPLRWSLWYLALVWSNGLMSYLVAAWMARRLYRRGFNRLSTGASTR